MTILMAIVSKFTLIPRGLNVPSSHQREQDVILCSMKTDVFLQTSNLFDL